VRQWAAHRPARPLAAQALEAAAADLEYGAGRFRIAGTDRGIGLFELAGKQAERRIVCEHTETVKGQTWPNGCQVVEVEVDPETGAVRVARHSAVDDIGRVINPLTAESQVHGGVAQGLGQVLGEQVVYGEDGQLVTASFMDYPMPRADDLPMLKLGHHVAPCTTNPLGAKGVGEPGLIPTAPAILGAIEHASGVRMTRVPVLPHRLREAIAAKGSNR